MSANQTSNCETPVIKTFALTSVAEHLTHTLLKRYTEGRLTIGDKDVL